MIAAIYLRKSRADLEAEARGAFETLRAHEERLTKLARERGISVGEIYRELVSGDTIAARPEMQRLLSDVRSGRWDGVIVTEISRLARGDTRDQGTVFEAFRASRTLIVTPEKTYDPTNDADQDFFDFSLFMARQEYKYIKRRMAAGRRQKLADGWFIASVPPYGYRKTPGNIEPDPVEAPIVQMIFERAATVGRSSLSRELFAQGIRKRGGSPFTPADLAYLLKNPAYLAKARINRKEWYVDQDGKRRYHWAPDTFIPGHWDPLVTPEAWEAAQPTREMKYNRNRKPRNVLGGLVVCKKCGAVMNLREDDNPAHVPRLRHPTRPDCRAEPTPMAEVLAELSAALKAAVDNLPVDLEPAPSVDVRALSSQLRAAEQKVARIYTFLESGVYTPEEYAQRITPAKAAVESLRAELDAAQKTPRPSAASILTHDAIDRMLFGDVVSGNRALKTFIDRIEYTREPGDDEPLLEIYFRG